MNHPENDIDFIERYLENTLTEGETIQFKNRLREDTEFRRLYNREKLLISTIRFSAAQKDLHFLKQLEHHAHGSQPDFFNKYKHYLAAAACVGLIALAVFIPSNQETSQELFASHFKPYPNVFEPTLRGDDTPTRRTEAFQAYEQGDYERASALFTELVKENREPGYLMLLGNSNLVMGKTTEAIGNFAELRDRYEEYSDEATWYLALCYLKDGNLRSARTLLENIAGSESPHAVSAQEILERLAR